MDKQTVLGRARCLKSLLRPRGHTSHQPGPEKLQRMCRRHMAGRRSLGDPEHTLWHKHHPEQKAFEFLKSLICLKTEPPKQLNCHQSSLGATWRDLVPEAGSTHLTPKTDSVTTVSWLPASLPRARLPFQKVICFPKCALLLLFPC